MTERDTFFAELMLRAPIAPQWYLEKGFSQGCQTKEHFNKWDKQVKERTFLWPSYYAKEVIRISGIKCFVPIDPEHMPQ